MALYQLILILKSPAISKWYCMCPVYLLFDIFVAMSQSKRCIYWENTISQAQVNNCKNQQPSTKRDIDLIDLLVDYIEELFYL